MFAQAHLVIHKFGGARNLAAVLGLRPSTVYKWTYPRDKGGTDGLIPASRIPKIMEVAIMTGVSITASDLDPSKIIVEDE